MESSGRLVIDWLLNYQTSDRMAQYQMTKFVRYRPTTPSTGLLAVAYILRGIRPAP